MLSLDRELDHLRLVASRLGRGRDEELIQEAILGISLHCRHTKETHAQEVAQLRDEIRVLHRMLAQREDSNLWRLLLQGRAEVEESVRKALETQGHCKALVVPLPPPLLTRTGSANIGRFVGELQCAAGDAPVKLWTAKAAIFLRVAGEGQQVPEIAALPETFEMDGRSYPVRSRAWEIASAQGERADDFLQRIDERGKTSNAA